MKKEIWVTKIFNAKYGSPIILRYSVRQMVRILGEVPKMFNTKNMVQPKFSGFTG